MRHFGPAFLGALLGTTTLASPGFAQAPAAGVTVTTQERLENPKPEDWQLVNGNYSLTHYSTLSQITTSTIKTLHPVYMLAMEGVEGGGSRYANGELEGTPLVEDGFMYASNGWGTVYKLDLHSGTRAQINWKMDPQVDKPWGGDVACCGINNRGVALWKDKVVSVTIDGRMIETNKSSGEIVWQSKVADPGKGETLTVAPLVIKDLAVVGPAGAEYGIRGHLMGIDLNTGKEVWRTYTVAGEDDPNAKTWAGKTNLTGGGSIWQTGSYDPKLNTMYWGTGNPGPDFDAEYRPGDNLYTDSVLAMTPETGKINWYFQYTPNDPFDYDEIGVHPLINVNINGQDRNMVIHAGRNGNFYGFDRTNGQFIFGQPYVTLVNWSGGIDQKTGKPVAYDPRKLVQDYVAGTAARRSGNVGTNCPVTGGGTNWEPGAYNPQLQVYYTASGEGCGQHVTKTMTGPVDQGGTFKPRDDFGGGGTVPPNSAPANPEWKVATYGSLVALDVKTGATIKKITFDVSGHAGVLAAADWVMTGLPDGNLIAFDAKTLAEVWRFNVGTAIKAPAMTFAVNGKQYVGLLVGALPNGNQLKQNPELARFSATHLMMVFGL